MSVIGVGLALNSVYAQSVPHFFLVAEHPRNVIWGDSFVIGLTNVAHIAHARELIAKGPAEAGAPIVMATIAGGADGVNRNLRSKDAATWSWHVTAVDGFADFSAELFDGWPTFVERDDKHPSPAPAGTKLSVSTCRSVIAYEKRREAIPTPRFAPHALMDKEKTDGVVLSFHSRQPRVVRTPKRSLP